MERRCDPSAEMQPSLPDKARQLAELRHRIARLEKASPALNPESEAVSGGQFVPLRVDSADRVLGGGFPSAALTEIRLAEPRGGGGGAGFLAGVASLCGASAERPLLWISERHVKAELGVFYAPGLRTFGLDPSSLLLVHTRRLQEALWAAEEAAGSGGAALVVLEVSGNPHLLGLEGTRRLHVRARASGLPLVLLRQAGQPEATAAPLRLQIAPAAAGAVPDLSHIGRLVGQPAFDVAVEKSASGRPGRFRLEWNQDERHFTAAEQNSGRVPAASVDRQAVSQKPWPVLAPDVSLARRRRA
jgi:protein ImuA